MKKTSHRLPRFASAASAVMAVFGFAFAALALTGCGGGGGGGGSSSTPTSGSANTTTFTGTVTNTETGQVPTGDLVQFDNGPSTAVTSTGTYSLTVPNSDFANSNTLNVVSSISNQVIVTVPVTGSTTTINITIGPPPTPPLVKTEQ